MKNTQIPSLSVLKTMAGKLWDFLLTDKPVFTPVILIFSALLIFAVYLFHGWAMYFLPAATLVVCIFSAFRIFVWLRNLKRRLPSIIRNAKDMLKPPATLEEWMGRSAHVSPSKSSESLVDGRGRP
jgi:hypothetical protein